MRSTVAGITLPSQQERDVLGVLLTALADIAMLHSGQLDVNASGSGSTDLTADQTRARIVRLTGAPAAGRVLRFETNQGSRNIIFHNATGGGVAVTVRSTAEAAGGVAVPDGQSREVYVVSGVTRSVGT